MPSKLDLIFSNWNNGDIKVERKYPIYLLIDTSASMNNFDGKNVPKIEEINIFLKEFFEFIRNDARAGKLSEISIITFGDKVKIVEEFKSIYYINAPHFTANGNKFLYEAMSLVLP